MPKSIINTVRNTVYGHGRGWVFTPTNFDNLNSSNAVRIALSRLEKERVIRRVAPGIYDFPRIHKTLGILSPSIDGIAKAFADKNAAKIQPTGAYAANLIGLSEQVPGKVVFLTDGPVGKVKVGKLEILFKKTSVKNMFAPGSREALVIQAFRFIKKESISQSILETTKKFRKEFEKNIKHAPYWIRVLLFKLMENELL